MGLNSTFLLILNNKNDGKNIAITDNIIPAKLRTCTNAFGTIIAMNTDGIMAIAEHIYLLAFSII